METFTVWHGAPTPIRARGRNVARLLAFAEKYRGWHTFANDPATRNAVNIGERDGWLDVRDDQFRFKYPERTA